jgi:hypothetical protein
VSVEVALEEHPLVRECSYCTRTHSTLVTDGEGGWMHADPADCRVVEVRVAGIVVDAVELAGAQPERWPVTRARWARDARFAALADAELLAAGEAHITRADVDAPTAEAIATALAAIVTRRDRLVARAEALPPSRQRGVYALASVRADRDLAVAALAGWVG